MGIAPFSIPGVSAAITSTSTPVLSENGILYVAVSAYNSATFSSVGAVLAFVPENLSAGSIATVYTGDPVQSSPIVYSSGAWDYVYFTTNNYAGSGYCYRRNANTGVVQPIWTEGGTSDNAYAVQGFAADEGHLVYGDDGNYLYIIKKTS